MILPGCIASGEPFVEDALAHQMAQYYQSPGVGVELLQIGQIVIVIVALASILGIVRLTRREKWRRRHRGDGLWPVGRPGAYGGESGAWWGRLA